MENYRVLDRINRPSDLEHLSRTQLEHLCAEIRHLLIHSVSKTGGHLASNLGAVELTVALHRVFRSPRDQIIWDVGHQCYTHKILTGRRDRMHTLRQKGGISGFTKTGESEHDGFISGHSSTSISVADGLARAKQLCGESGHVIAVIGDGAFTGGMTLEGLNNAARGNRDLIIILNDNSMSISRNVGTLSRYLARLRSNKRYFRLKDIAKSAIGSIPVVGDELVEVVSSSKAQLKNVVYDTSFFEEMGYVHMGPVDGHNLNMLTDVLERAKTLHKPVLIHVETMKGKGYLLAEKNPGAYHGVGPFDPLVGVANSPSANNYSTVFGKHLTELAKKENRICAVTAAMKYGTGLNFFSREFKQQGRFFDVGIAEQHGVTFCAALAAKGLIPVFAVYSSFLQRAYDQLIHDCSIEKRHVVLAIDRAGLVGEDGETHQGIFDCALLTGIPGTSIYSPATYEDLRLCLERAIMSETGLCAVRYPRGGQPELPSALASACVDACWYDPSDQSNLLIISYGRVVAEAARAAQILRDQGVSTAVLKLVQIWPLDSQTVSRALQYNRILFVEEGVIHGGIGEHFLLELSRQGYRGDYSILGIEDFVPQASVAQQMAELGLDCDGIVRHYYNHLTERKSS